MQQEINLYQQLPQKKRSYLTKRNIFLSFGALLGFIFVLDILTLTQVHMTKKQYNVLNAEITTKQKQLATLTAQFPVHDPAVLEKMLNDLQKQYRIKTEMIDLLTPYANYTSYLMGLAKSSLRGVWLTQINFNRGEKKITLKGYSVNAAILSTFYNQLTKEPLFGEMTFKLEDIQETKLPASFIITANKASSS